MSSETEPPYDLSHLEERKRQEIERSRVRRSILQNSERRSDTNASEAAPGLDDLIRDKAGFEAEFTNIKFYSVARSSEEYEYDWLRRHCREGVKVLDFGCGNGENGIFAAQCGAEVVGIDISPDGIENARLNAIQAGVAQRCRFEVMDGESMTFADDTFDIAVEYGALHHVDLSLALPELSRVLTPTGEMICVEALRHNPLIHAYRRRTPTLRTPWEVEHILGIESLDLARQYFANVDVKFFHLAVLAAVPFRKTAIFRPLRQALEGIDKLLLKSPSIGKYGWIMVFVMRGPRDRATQHDAQ